MGWEGHNTVPRSIYHKYTWMDLNSSSISGTRPVLQAPSSPNKWKKKKKQLTQIQMRRQDARKARPWGESGLGTLCLLFQKQKVMQSTLISLSSWVMSQMWPLCKGILFYHRKKHGTDLCSPIEKPEDDMVNGNKPVRKIHSKNPNSNHNHNFMNLCIHNIYNRQSMETEGIWMGGSNERWSPITMGFFPES